MSGGSAGPVETAAGTGVQHVAVEFVHPMIVGKRAFPAISLTADIATQTAEAIAVMPK